MMRAQLLSLTVLGLAAPAAFAQTPAAAPPPSASPPAASAPPAEVMPAPTAPASAAPATRASPTASAPAATPAPMAPPSNATAVPPPAPGTTAADAPAALAATTSAPAGPPPAPTDPTAIALISTLENVCVPAVAGGKMDKLAKAGGYRKSGENYVMKGKGFQLTVLAPGSNPKTCHIDVVSPIDPEAPAKPLVVALHNWAAVSRGYTLYRNDKNVANGQELTTRSWENNAPGNNDALVLTTFRKADGTPSGGHETSEVLFTTNGTSAS